MHDIGGHICNIIEELPHHLPDNERALFNQILDICYRNKDSNRVVDKRKAILFLTVHLDGKVSNKVIRLLKTLTEIQRILYLKENDRTMQEVLRLHNSCFQHTVPMKEVIGFQLKKLTREKLYGKYMHNLLVHSPIQFRIINGRSINCEGEERFFNTIKNITCQTTSYKPGHIIGNCFIRHQVEERCKDKYTFGPKLTNDENEINSLNNLIKSQYDTIFTYKFIEENPRDWQAHLERISDFLLEGEGVWWIKSQFGVEFNDSSTLDILPLLPKLQNFRSSKINDVEMKLQEDWKTLIDSEDIVVPISI